MIDQRDAENESGVECTCGKSSIAPEVARVHVTPALARVRQLMRDIRATGKCGMFVVRWDGAAWCFHLCDAPVRVNEA